MLTYEDCLEICEFSDEEIAAIAQHEHLPDMVAVEFASYLARSEDGVPMLRRIIVEDIEHAVLAGHDERASCLRSVLGHFIATHPERGSGPV